LGVFIKSSEAGHSNTVLEVCSKVSDFYMNQSLTDSYFQKAFIYCSKFAKVVHKFLKLF